MYIKILIWLSGGKLMKKKPEIVINNLTYGEYMAKYKLENSSPDINIDPKDIEIEDLEKDLKIANLKKEIASTKEEEGNIAIRILDEKQERADNNEIEVASRKASEAYSKRSSFIGFKKD